MSDSKHIPVESLLAVLAGLSLAACEKTRGEASAEPVPASSAPAQRESGAGTEAENPVRAKEVPAAASGDSGSVQMTCAPGGCAPGKCGGAKPPAQAKPSGAEQ
ncbi:MAG: hypothetical protein DIU78_009435 [Pseudomonadota bacterium]|nr:MAG: hypothetical protein DIU78_00630 [Pseudomonadota bacterium]